MDVKTGDKVLIRWPPAPNGKSVVAHVIAIPGNGRSHYQLQFENSQKKITCTSSDLDKIFLKLLSGPLRSSLGAALTSSKPKIRPTVEIGCRVTIERGDGSIREYTITEPGLGNHRNSELDSMLPLGKALIGASEGEEITVNGQDFRIAEVEAPPPLERVLPTSKLIGSIDEIRFEEDKEPVIKCGFSLNQIVMAPPGTGKSYTLSHRAAFLIEKFAVSPNEVLILSFSREAVAEVQRRLKRFESPYVSLIQPLTIDSFAASINLKNKKNYQFESYEKSILDATALMSAEDTVGLKHVFVDEFQDIVGIRAKFILSLFKALPKGCGVTLLGDLEQSIYHWALDPENINYRSDEFLKEATQLLGTNGAIRYLSRNFRVSNQKLRELISSFRSFLETELSQEQPGELELLKKSAHDRVEAILPCESSGRQKFHRELLPKPGKSTCVLFRDNGQIISETDTAKPTKIKIKALGKYNRGLMPSWYAVLMRDSHDKGKFIQKDPNFMNWFSTLKNTQGWSADSSWSLLKSIEGNHTHGHSLDTFILRHKIQMLREVPMTDHERRQFLEPGLIFSTFHASKGLEFDNVFLSEPDFSYCKSHLELLDEARTFYVGMTRAKESLMLLPRSSISSLRSKPYMLGKTEERRWFRDEGGRRFFNVDNEYDVDASSFIMDFGRDRLSVDRAQHLLADEVKEGDQVQLVMKDFSNAGFFRNYFIFWKENMLGSMSLSFRDSISRLFYGSEMPVEFTATIGRIYSEYRYFVNGSYPLESFYTNNTECWLAMKLSGLSNAARKT